MLHAPPISFLSILSTEKYWVRSTDHSVPLYAASSTHRGKSWRVEEQESLHTAVVQQASNVLLWYSYKTVAVKVLTCTYSSFIMDVNLHILSEYKLNTLYNVLSSKVEAFLRGFRLSNLQPNALILSTRKCSCDKGNDNHNTQRRVTVKLR
jgi:hypothetical protein